MGNLSVLRVGVQGNSTQGPPDAALRFTVPVTQALLVGNASQETPITGLTVHGVGFRDTMPTYMEPHGVPSGGDWALERLGALFMEGTVNLTVEVKRSHIECSGHEWICWLQACSFERLDGNALMLSGFHRGAQIKVFSTPDPHPNP